MKQVRYIGIGFFAIFGIVASATADEYFEARIAYNPDHSVIEIYESINQTVRDTCRVQYRKNSTTSLSNRFVIQKDCQRILMDSALEVINRPDLIALHNQTKRGHARLAVLQASTE